MFKILFAFFAIPIAMSSNGMFAKELPKDAIMQSYNNGKEIVLTEKDVDEIDRLLSEALCDSHPMPAFGVSLHDETLQDIQNGIWIRVSYQTPQEVDGMPFDELLFKVKQDMYGFNIIRGNLGRYEGRCFYVDITQNMDTLFGYLQLLPTSEEAFSLQKTDSENNYCGKLLFDAISGNIPTKHVSAFAIEKPDANQKPKQNTVISCTAKPDKNKKGPGFDDITF